MHTNFTYQKIKAKVNYCPLSDKTQTSNIIFDGKNWQLFPDILSISQNSPCDIFKS